MIIKIKIVDITDIEKEVEKSLEEKNKKKWKRF